MELWSRRPISQRIILAFGTMLICSVILALLTVIGMVGIARANMAIVKGHERQLDLAELVFAIKDADSKAGYLKRIVTTRPEDLTAKDDITISMMALQIQNTTDKVRPIIMEMASGQLKDFDKSRENALKYMARWESARGFPTLVEITAALQELNFLSSELQKTLLAGIEKDIKGANARLAGMAILLVAFNLVIVAALLIIILPIARELRGVFTPMRKASETALEGANNALSYAAEIDELIAQLRSAMAEVGRATQEVASAAQESSTHLAEIMNSVKDTTDSTGQLSEEAAMIYDSLATHQNLLEERTAQIRRTATVVEQLLGKITQNADVAERLTAQVTALREQLAGIETFLAAMNDITDQTELLALNASIEAARAGEHGVGFMVVAERLRKLSDQTKGFTTQIEATITRLQESTSRGASAFAEVIANVRDSVSRVSEVTHEFSTLEELITSLQGAHSRIIAAANAQLDKAKEIYRSTTEIMHSVETLSAQTEEVSAAMEELSAEGQEIIGQIQHISKNVSDTRSVVEHQVELARMAKEAADRY